MATSHILRQNPSKIRVGTHDVITYAKFGEDRLKRLGLAMGHNFWLSHWLALSILTTRCKCV